MQRTKIEWTDYVWNPIKGLCPEKCFFCYARKMYKRFGWNERVRVDEKEMYGNIFPKKPSKIFVCSTFELFHPSVHALIRDAIFARIGFNSQHTFQILTKRPQNIDRKMPDNVWLGVSITGIGDLGHHSFLPDKAKTTFVSYEPLLRDLMWMPSTADWFIVGRMTGYRNRYDPERGWIEKIVEVAKQTNTAIFLKDNLKDIWKLPLIQEFPE
jgi:protein gp37